MTEQYLKIHEAVAKHLNRVKGELTLILRKFLVRVEPPDRTKIEPLINLLRKEYDLAKLLQVLCEHLEIMILKLGFTFPSRSNFTTALNYTREMQIFCERWTTVVPDSLSDQEIFGFQNLDIVLRFECLIGLDDTWIRELVEMRTALGKRPCSLNSGDFMPVKVEGTVISVGESVKAENDESVKSYRLGPAEAQFNLGTAYDFGEGVEEDMDEAVKLYRQAAEQGHAEAQFNLGIAYDFGEGVKEDKSEAVKWYRQAAEQGHAEAQFYLGMAYDFGEGVEEDMAEAVKWYRQAAEQGHAKAQFYWYQLDAEQGHAEAQFNLGMAYDKGNGVEADKAEAVKMYQLAAEQGHTEAQFCLARAYDFGEGVEEDKSEAVKWYRLAAENGHAEAKCYLGLADGKGKGVEPDEDGANIQPISSGAVDDAKPGPPEFKMGDMVCLKSNSSERGAVIGILPGVSQNSFKVWINNSSATFFAEQLEAVKKDKQDCVQSCEQFHAYLSALQLNHPGLSTLYSLKAARIDYLPYQFKPVLRLIRSERPRLLIADGVGVGKTIEAGLILKELQARREINSVLIVCPRPLITENKWKNEMKRFGENFTHLDKTSLQECLDTLDSNNVWPEEHKKTIVPYSLFSKEILEGSIVPVGNGSVVKHKKGLLSLNSPPHFDLLIIDEAHHIRNTKSKNYKAVEYFCEHTEAVIFLTATPIQISSNDLFVLMNLLRPDLIIDPESFKHMTAPNPFINAAVSSMRSGQEDWQKLALEALQEAAYTQWGTAILKDNPNFKNVCSKLKESELSREERVKMISETEEMHTLAGIINRTRRRDIGKITERKPQTVEVPFTDAQKNLHDELLRIQAEIFSRLFSNNNVRFMLTTLRRQAASCIFGLAPFLEDILKHHLDELSWAEADDSDVPDVNAINPIKIQIQSLLTTTSAIDANDPKLDKLREIIRDKQSLPNNKIMIFSSFRHTLNYLYSHLKDEFRIGLVHGDTKDVERVIFRENFKKPKEDKDCLDLLLFSEIGSEGLDYQFCDCIVNYDLPWNPMRIEQRIGRIDRMGQKSATIAIFNLITPGTVDADIYERCLSRIGVFENALGGSEEILGEITQKIIKIAENFKLTKEQQRKQFDELMNNEIRQIQDQEELEQNEADLFSLRIPKGDMKSEIDAASSFWLAPNSLLRLVTLYLRFKCDTNQELIQGEKPLKNLRLSQTYRSLLLQDFQLLPKQNTSFYRMWESWLKGGGNHLHITFEYECAIENTDATFIMPLHPLVKQAAKYFVIV